MKFVLVLALVAIALTASAEGKSDKVKNKNNCSTMCPALYDPVCAQDQSVKGSRPRTFGNECVMKAHNCENTAFMEVLYKGECKGSGGVRLS